MKRVVRRLGIAAVGLSSAVAHGVGVHPAVVSADPVETTAVVLKVVDGDTVDVRDDVRGRLRIRVLGIDTPETLKPGYTVGCWGPGTSRVRQTDLARSAGRHCLRSVPGHE